MQHDLEILDGVGFWHSSGKGKLNGCIVNKLLINGKEVKSAKKGEKVKIPSTYFKNSAQVYLTSRNEGRNLVEGKLINLPLKIIAKVGSPLILEYKDLIIQSTIPLQEPQKESLSEEDIRSEFRKSSKSGINWDIDLELEKVFFPKRLLKETRELLEQKLREKVVLPRISKFTGIPAVLPKEVNSEPKLIVKVYSLSQLQEANATGVEIIYYDIFSPDLNLAKKLCTNAKFFLDTPVVITDKDIEKIKNIIENIKPDGITIGNWGLLGIDFKGEKHGKYSLNIFNDVSAAGLLEKEVLPTISPELNTKQILNMKNKEFIYYAHGQIPVMHFKGAYSEKSLTDEMKYTFPLRTVNGNTEMLYSRPLAMFEKIKELIDGGVKYYLLDLNRDTTTIIKAYQNIINGVKQDISFLKKGTTIGNWVKGVA